MEAIQGQLSKEHGYSEIIAIQTAGFTGVAIIRENGEVCTLHLVDSDGLQRAPEKGEGAAIIELIRFAQAGLAASVTPPPPSLLKRLIARFF